MRSEGKCDVNNLTGMDRGDCNKYDIGDVGLVKTLSRLGGGAGSASAPNIHVAWTRPLLFTFHHQVTIHAAIQMA